MNTLKSILSRATPALFAALIVLAGCQTGGSEHPGQEHPGGGADHAGTPLEAG